MSYLIRLFSLGLFLLSLAALAETRTGSPNEIFRPISKEIVQKVADQGVKQIGRVKIQTLLDELDTVEWRTFDIGFLSGSGGTRQTSIYIVKDRMVVVNMLALQNLVDKPVRINRWALHEALGALGYPDEVYDLTVALTFMASTADLAVSDRLNLIDGGFTNAVRSATDHVYGREGGTTIIGGGGDAPMIEFKSRILEHFFLWARVHHPEMSERKLKKAFQRLVALKMEFDKVAGDMSSTAFVVKHNALYIGEGANYHPDPIYEVAYLESVLVALEGILFK